jgi:hypothetical protein
MLNHFLKVHNLPNPFSSSAVILPGSADEVAPSSQQAPILAGDGATPFVLDEQAFMDAIMMPDLPGMVSW